jgi:transposase
VRVLRHVRKKYACPHCQLGIKTAPLPPQPLPKTMASPGLLAHIAVAKYQDALPLHRQEHILKRIGVDLPRATLAAWMIKLGIWIQPLINLLQDVLLGYDVLQMDETTLQVLKEPAKLPQSNSYLWVRRGGPPDLPVLLFDYDPSRSQAVPLRLLEGYRGYVQVDGYDGYNAVGLRSDIVLVGCMAHARRKFDEAVKAQGVDRDNPQKIGKAMEGLRYLQALYRIERECKGSFSEERYSVRQQKAKPLFETLRAWLDAALPTVVPQSMTGKALTYLHNQWPKLIRYLDDGRLSIDNNRGMPYGPSSSAAATGYSPILCAAPNRVPTSTASLKPPRPTGSSPMPTSATSSPSCPRPRPSNRSRRSYRFTPRRNSLRRHRLNNRWG